LRNQKEIPGINKEKNLESNKSLSNKLLSDMNSEGLKLKFVSISRLSQLKEVLEETRTSGLIDKAFYKERLSWFDFSPPKSLPNASSIIIISVPQPKIKVTFQWKKQIFHLTIPPTYLHDPDEKAKMILENILSPSGYRIERTSLPLKILAVRSGLAEYGKNNITYIKETGSFHRLVGFYSDFPCQKDDWRAPKIMDRCKNCSACIKNCPTGAIMPGRFPVKAEHCLTFHNERANPFPKWIKSDFHHCIVGCLECQSICPVNKYIFKWEEFRGYFSEKETSMILNMTSKNNIPAHTLGKIEQLSLTEYLELLPRNLEAAIKNHIS